MPTSSLAARVVSTSHTAVGVLSWIAPDVSWRVFGLGRLDGTGAAAPSARVMSRLFGVRDVALGLALRHPDPAVRRAGLQVGLVIDLVDAVASVRGLAQGAPRGSALGVTAGAALLAGLGAVALGAENPR